MADEVREVEMRIDGLSQPGRREALERSLRALDPDLTLRVDAATGIAHLTTRFDTLEIVAALRGDGIEASAMTG